MDMTQKIRNFCIIAHIDHGKSTLADRLIEQTGTLEKRQMQEQMLDGMDLERERGITIKLTPVRMEYILPSEASCTPHPTPYTLNLIDTPGHVDFAYEVSRSLAAVEGAVLLVDATQGIQAQTMANLTFALEAGLTIVAAVNKIDLPAADVAGTRRDIAKLTGIPEEEVLLVSAKTGVGVPELLESIVKNVPPPSGSEDKPFRALVFDSFFDAYKGVVTYIRVVDGKIKKNQEILFAGENVRGESLELGILNPKESSRDELCAGEIGYVATGLRDVAQARVGDTIIHFKDRDEKANLVLPGYTVPQPKVFAGIYPHSGEDFRFLRDALGKYRLNDASLQYEQETSTALGQGFRCGFLGLLHLSIVQERLKREYNIEVTITVPSVAYRVKLRNGQSQVIRTPTEFPDPSALESTEEQWVLVEIISRAADIGGILPLISAHAGVHRNTEYLSADRVLITAEMPLREVVIDLHDALKSASAGYASLSYDMLNWRPTDLIKLSILVAEETVEPLSMIVPREQAQREGRRIVAKLKEAIPRHLFAVAIQAAIGGKVIARETIPAMRKDVTGYLYGGDVTRKKKLLEKQKKGKKKMAKVGSVDIPPGAYLAALGKSE
jgi:GTP-binding protein LepA